ncbi:hypothetical protein MLD38_007164 [Melastoma candidum]|uniref:Uncharacterized protein n=1 Tax=Melastoma candidum TaxID=119954 RepID=A0ACB9RRG2_9MYRT|nr:hypothetical protein MLD38_007164 [Melastoma candidum]
MDMAKILSLMFGFVSLHVVILLAQPIPGFISIDSGVTNEYTDTYNRIYYETDTGYADTGTNWQVSSDNFGDGFDARSKNMRIFPNGTRNCYTLRPQNGKGNKYLIRASFSYGNYDNRSSPPAFDIHIDVNSWLTYSGSRYFCQEVIYILQRDYVQVCLINTGNGVPFISAVELRLLDNGIYPFESGALVREDRYAMGSSRSIRYPDDPFDRIWYKLLPEDFQAATNTTAIEIDPNNNPYKVPTAVLKTAAVSNVLRSFNLSRPSNSMDGWHFYLYFAEIQLLQQNQTREFSVYIDNMFNTTENLEYSTLTTIPSGLLTGQTIVGFNLTSTARSTLSPIINAFETYKVLELPNSMTYPGDVEAIYNIRTTYGLAKTKESWQGDPCSPVQYKWSGLTCSDDSAPRIVSINLTSSGLTGPIAPALANLTSLQSLDLSNNQLMESVPDFLAQMPSLKILNLGGNNLNGLVPLDLMKKAADGMLLLSIEGNPNLCNSSYCKSTGEPSERRLGFVVPLVTSVSGVIVVVSLVTIAAVTWSRARERRDESSPSMLKTFTPTEIEGITNNFKMIIGEGAFGKVYLGRLDGGAEVAVKVLSQMSRQGHKEFQAEVKLLAVVHHRNLVSLVGYCDDPKSLVLVYEYMSNGNVRDHLLRHEMPVLSWLQRLQIAVGAAQGLEYLHSGCKPPIIHRDLKPANILLDNNMQAKIADFGLSRAFRTDYDSHVSTNPAGTPGYVDPEYESTGNFNQKSDIYSFGVILFELITGQPALLKEGHRVTHIVRRVTPLIERGDIESIIDPRLQGKFRIASAWKVVEVALSCVPTAAVQRPDMGLVLSELKECMAQEISSLHGQRRGAGNQCNSIEMSSLDPSEMSPDSR